MSPKQKRRETAMEFYGSDIVKMYCQNCGSKVFGYRSRDRTARIVCERCGVKMVSKKKSEKIIDTRLIAPDRAAIY